MRTLIRDGVLIDGTGSAPLPHASLVIEDHVVEEVIRDPSPPYDRSDVVIEANGGYILPGILNHHAHGMTRGPLMILGEPALSDERAGWNRQRMLAEGVTRVLNVDGFAVAEEGRAASRSPGLTVMTTTLHTPRHLDWATNGPFVFGGILARHHSTVEAQLAQGAPAIGEIGPGIDDHWIDYTIVPMGLSQAGGRPEPQSGQLLRIAVEAGDETEIRRLVEQAGADLDPRGVVELVEAAREWCSLGEAACEEAISLAAKLEAPVIMHHTPGVFDLVMHAADVLGPRLICAHSNWGIADPAAAIRRAKELRHRGALIDVMTGDVQGARRFLPNDGVTHGMMASGCVDLISTDYGGGFWDSMLSVVDRAASAGAMPMEAGICAITRDVARALPVFAPERGTLEPGTIADVVVTKPGQLPAVAAVLTSGIRVGASGGR